MSIELFRQDRHVCIMFSRLGDEGGDAVMPAAYAKKFATDMALQRIGDCIGVTAGQVHRLGESLDAPFATHAVGFGIEADDSRQEDGVQGAVVQAGVQAAERVAQGVHRAQTFLERANDFVRQRCRGGAMRCRGARMCHQIAEQDFSDAGGIRPDGTKTPHTTTVKIVSERSPADLSGYMKQKDDGRWIMAKQPPADLRDQIVAEIDKRNSHPQEKVNGAQANQAQQAEAPRPGEAAQGG